ncbi:L-amino acid N-acyltransferase YncA [Nocardia tenerifensis]|uniref:L-amino acid N-acyltransferase YncA n=1 Tax=Nocardia tenerifensis TaxID=228006 RepID=A0A318JVF5_9NOCA|nr:GNAT family N-acetyltransferase [Nocardia tenerifensis]PXX61104.1 L-amino acid N-acyltransferase YncA [Nocardia tenerifensis]
MRIREGRVGDVSAVLALGDEAVVWLNRRGNTEQWGSAPWTGNERRAAMIREHATGSGMRVMEDENGSVVGVLVITEKRQEYVPEVDERELYVNLLLTSRRHRGIGAALMRRAMAEAAERGIDLLRVDCFAGGDGALVKVYESYGFSPVQEITVGTWPGMVLAMRLSEQPR